MDFTPYYNMGKLNLLTEISLIFKPEIEVKLTLIFLTNNIMRKNFTLLVLLLASAITAGAQNAMTTINLTAKVVTVASYTDKEVIIDSQTDLHLTATTNVLVNSIIKLNSEDSWVFFDNLTPQVVIDTYLKYIYVNNQLAVNKTNARVAIYKHGTVVMPHGSNFMPLRVFTGKDFTGESTAYPLFVYNNALGASFDNKIRSFKLKRGYSATLATLPDGLGYSRVFIADDKDLEMANLPTLLDKSVSFIRIFNWEYVTKKGWCGTGSGGGTDVEKVAGTWWYSWSADQNSKNNQEYVPIKQNLGWPGWDQINGKQYVSHLLGYNEPNRPDQSNMTVAQALAAWPEYMKSGLRLGSPSPSDPFGSNGAWLYEFLDSCKARNYRVDYVVIHAYWAKSPQQWYNDLKWVYQKTGLPIWITEWNNGANWTNETWPTADRSLSSANATKQLNDLKAILNVLDTASFVERYSIYNWVQDCRAMLLNGNLTPAGEYYKNNKSVMAFNRKYEVIPTFIFRSPSLNVAFSSNKLSLSITDPNVEAFSGYIMEKKLNDGTYTEVARSENPALKTYAEDAELTGGTKVRYRVRTILVDGTITGYSNEVGYDVTQSGEIQCGNLSFSNVAWNPVLFKTGFTSSKLPAIILGAPTYNNPSVLMAPRPKLISAATHFNIQLSPWAYQNVSTLSKEEKVPYLVAGPGNYNFGGLAAKAGRASVSSTWTTVTFTEPFDTIPVVFTSQLSPSTVNATTVRVRNITNTGFQAKLQKETAITVAPSLETVSYFAITPGTGMMDNRKMIVGKTGNTAVTASTYTTIQYGDSIGNPVFLTQMQTCNDDTVTATLRCLSVNAKFANVIKQRERSTGATYAAAESAGWLVIEPSNIVQSLNATTKEEIRIYPNPVKDILFIGLPANVETVMEIRNISGTLVRRVYPHEGRVNVSDLPSGYYFISGPNLKSNKFIKL